MKAFSSIQNPLRLLTTASAIVFGLLGISSQSPANEEQKAKIQTLTDQIHELSFSTTANDSEQGRVVEYLKTAKQILRGVSEHVIRDNVADIDISGSTLWIIDSSNNLLTRPPGEDFKVVANNISTIDAVSPNLFYTVNTSREIISWNHGSPSRLPGLAYDVAGNSSGKKCIIGTNGSPHCWQDGVGWRQLAGLGYRIAVEENGTLWMVGTNNLLYTYANDRWYEPNGVNLPCKDVLAGADGEIYIVGLNDTLSKVNKTSSTTTIMAAQTKAAGITSDGRIFVVDTEGQLLRP